MNRFDVVVSGSGVSGAIAALSLADAGFSVALIERYLPLAAEVFDPNLPAAYSRVVALAPASIQVLSRLQQWPLVNGAAAAYRKMQVRAGDCELEFDHALIAEPALGWIIDLAVLQHSLWRALPGKVELAVPAEIISVVHDPTELRLQLDNGQQWRSRLLVVAEGSTSSLRERAGIKRVERDYQARALVAKIRTRQMNPGIAFQQFDSGGPIALLPLADGGSSLVWTRPTSEAEALSALSDEAFAAAVGQACQDRFGLVLKVESRAWFPLRMAIAETMVGQRLALIGDSAHVVHPLAGLGLNLGILDAAALLDVLTQARQQARDIGSNATLSRYAAWREGDNLLAARLIDGVERVFAAGHSGLLGFAQRGLNLVDVLTPLKRFFALQAAGFGGRIPSLACRH